MGLRWTFSIVLGGGVELHDITDEIERLGLDWELLEETAQEVKITAFGVFQDLIELIYLYTDYQEVEYYVVEMLEESGVI